MKKIPTIALTFALALSLNLTSFAAVNTEGGSQDIDVNAKYVDSVDTPTVYHVDVAWGEMEFTYTVSGTKTWDSATHTYTISTADEWTATGNEITITNHSNTAIKANLTYENAPGFDTVTGNFSQNTLTLPSAEDKTTTDLSLTGKTALTLGGTLSSDKTDLTKVGKVTVKISKS